MTTVVNPDIIVVIFFSDAEAEAGVDILRVVYGVDVLVKVRTAEVVCCGVTVTSTYSMDSEEEAAEAAEATAIPRAAVENFIAGI